MKMTDPLNMMVAVACEVARDPSRGHQHCCLAFFTRHPPPPSQGGSPPYPRPTPSRKWRWWFWWQILKVCPLPWVTTRGWSFYTSQFTAGAARWSMVHFAQLTLSLDWDLDNMASSSDGTLFNKYWNILPHQKKSKWRVKKHVANYQITISCRSPEGQQKWVTLGHWEVSKVILD